MIRLSFRYTTHCHSNKTIMDFLYRLNTMSYWDPTQYSISKIITESGQEISVADLSVGKSLVIDNTTIRSTDAMGSVDKITFKTGQEILPDQLNALDVGRVMYLSYSIHSATQIKISMNGFIIGEDYLRYDVALLNEIITVSVLVQNTIVGIDNNGAIFQDIVPNLAHTRNRLPLVNVVTPAGSVALIIPVFKHLMRAANLTALFSDYILTVHKGDLITGVNYAPKALTMMLARTGGTSISPGGNYGIDQTNPNVLTIAPSTSDQHFASTYRDGIGGWTTVLTTFTAIPLYYDDNSGTLASIPANKWVIQLLYYNRAANMNVMLYAQVLYDTFELCKSAFLQSTYVPAIPDVITMYFKLRTAICLKYNATDLTSATNNAVYQIDGTTGGGASGTISNHAVLTNLDYTSSGHTNFQMLTRNSPGVPAVDLAVNLGTLYINSTNEDVYLNTAQVWPVIVNTWRRVLTEDATNTTYARRIALYPDGVTKTIACPDIIEIPFMSGKVLATNNTWWRICKIDTAVIEVSYIKFRTTQMSFSLQSSTIDVDVNTNIYTSVAAYHHKEGGTVQYHNSTFSNVMVVKIAGIIEIYVHASNVNLKHKCSYQILDISPTLFDALELTSVGSTAPFGDVILDTRLDSYPPNDSYFGGHLMLATALNAQYLSFHRTTGVIRLNGADVKKTILIKNDGSNNLGTSGNLNTVIKNGADEYFTITTSNILPDGFEAVVCNFTHSWMSDPYIGNPFVTFSCEPVTASDDTLKYSMAALKSVSTTSCTINVYNLHDTLTFAVQLRVRVTGITA